MLDPLLSKAAVALLNRMLAREAWARERLRPFSGKTARFDAPPFSIMFTIADDGLCIAPLPAATLDTAPPPDVTLGFSASALPEALFDPKALMRKVRLSGDAEFAQALGHVLPKLKLEPEEELAPFFGDAMAVRMVSFARNALDQLREGGARMASTTVDYLVAENPMLVDRQAMQMHAVQVVELRDAVERLEQRIALLTPHGLR